MRMRIITYKPHLYVSVSNIIIICCSSSSFAYHIENVWEQAALQTHLPHAWTEEEEGSGR